jgi:hypothetical protein
MSFEFNYFDFKELLKKFFVEVQLNSANRSKMMRGK